MPTLSPKIKVIIKNKKDCNFVCIYSAHEQLNDADSGRTQHAVHRDFEELLNTSSVCLRDAAL